MDSKLKSLKVADLKVILQRANLTIGSKSNKQDLIAKILASPPALDVYNSLYPSPKSTDPPTDSTTVAQPPSPAKTDSTPVASQPPATTNGAAAVVASTNSASQPASKPPQTPAAQTSPSADATVDPELEKKKARAARFGIPLVVDPPPKTSTRKVSAVTQSVATGEDPEKINARKARWGEVAPIQTSDLNGKTNADPSRPGRRKRSSFVEDQPDEEELERRRKRAQRFGTGKPEPAKTEPAKA